MNNNFTYSAIGDNTLENREHLEKIGYKKYDLRDESKGKEYIITHSCYLNIINWESKTLAILLHRQPSFIPSCNNSKGR
ncbi:MAG: hypothetical protein LBS20_20050 [Prevotella sp.]|jgi:hypothetical protein|nr:hypothetical protein [Prevotella sp.]